MFWPPQDTTGRELAPGPDACRGGDASLPQRLEVATGGRPIRRDA
jgi:hypothetical protein